MCFQELRYYVFVFYAAIAFRCLIFLVILLARMQTCLTQANLSLIQETDQLLGSTKWSTHRTGLAMKIIGNVSLRTCVKECYLRSNCEAAGYRRLYRDCRLYDGRKTETSVTLQTEPGSIYVDVNSLGADQVMHGYWGACSQSNCPAGFRCKDYGSLGECEPSECPRPPDVSNADLHIISQAVGIRAKYKCKSGFKHIGMSVITCQQNLTWTETSFQCTRFYSLSGFNTEITKNMWTMDFEAAKSLCAQFEGGRLLKIKSDEKHVAMKPFFATTSYQFYIDGHRNSGTEAWTYSDGEALPNCCWRPGKPNNFNQNEHCIITQRRDGVFAWDDVNCSLTFRSICEVVN